jgi:phasin family protein
MDQNFSTMLDSMAQANEKAMTAAAELQRIAARAHGQMVRKQIDTFETCLDAGARHVKVATEVRDPKEAMQQHTEVAVELGEKLVAATQEAFELQVQARDELTRWFEQGMNAVKAEAEAAMKPSAPDSAPAPAPARRTARSVKKAD